MSKTQIFSSSGLCLVFEDSAARDRYDRKLELLHVQTYTEIRNEHGVWAGNQNKFVKSREDLNQHDGTYMENLYDKYQEQT
jgi:hypothetical protein